MFFSCHCCDVIDPPGHGRIDGHHFHAWCPSVRPSVRPSQKQKRAATLKLVPEVRATTGTMMKIDLLMSVASWVILNWPDLFYSVFPKNNVNVASIVQRRYVVRTLGITLFSFLNQWCTCPDFHIFTLPASLTVPMLYILESHCKV